MWEWSSEVRRRCQVACVQAPAILPWRSVTAASAIPPPQHAEGPKVYRLRQKERALVIRWCERSCCGACIVRGCHPFIVCLMPTRFCSSLCSAFYVLPLVMGTAAHAAVQYASLSDGSRSVDQATTGAGSTSAIICGAGRIL